jgi:hypothetical protein
MKKLNLVVITMLIVCYTFAQYPGSISLIHTHTGRVFDQGDLEVHTNMNFFTKLGKLKEGVSQPSFKAVNWWNISGNVMLTFGLLNHFDISVSPRVYQDLNFGTTGKAANIPDDLFLTLKAGSFAFANRKFYAAGMINMRIPTGEGHNIYFSEYSGGALEYGLMAALSYYIDPYFPDRAFSTHLNLGWFNHNEAGKTVSGRNIAQENSTEFQFGLGFLYPMEMFEFMLELNGINYLQQPEPFVFARENWMYISPAICYKPLYWLSMELGLDYLILDAKDESSYIPTADIPNYSTWKVNLGINIRILPITPASESQLELQRRQFGKRVDFFKGIIEEREKVENVQEELEKLKRDREEAEKELEVLKKILEGQE